MTITAFRPVVPKPTSTLRVRGSVVNTSEKPVSNVTVALRLSPTPLNSRSEIGEVLSGNTTREGIRMASTMTTLTVELPPQASVDFTLEVPVDTLTLPQPGTYVTAVEALGDAGVGFERQALARTFLPWWPPGTEAQPIGLTLLWPLTGPALRDATGTYLDDELAVQMSTAGRLSNLVSGAAEAAGRVTWVIDPQVVQAAQDMAGGYRVYIDPQTQQFTRGTRSSEAAAWLTALTVAVNDPGARVMSGLYADPDVEAAKEGGALGNLLSQQVPALAQMADILGRSASGNLVIAPGGNLSEPTLARLAGHVSGVALAQAAMPTVQPVNYSPTGAAELTTEDGTLPAALLDGGLTAALAMPAESPQDAILLRQRILAETLTAALEAPNMERTLAGSPQPEWSATQTAIAGVLRATDVPWVKPVTAMSLLSNPDTGLSRVHAPLSQDQIDAQLPAGYVSAARANQRTVTSYRAMVSDSDEVPLAMQQAPTRQLSAFLRTRPTPRASMASLVSGQVAAAVDSVRVVSSGSITISGESGTIPVTVSNDGVSEVTVGLEFNSNPPQLFHAEPVAPFQIEPGKLTSIEVRATVAGAANVPVAIQLVAKNGRPVGEPTILVVRSAAYARVARVIVQLSLVLLVGAVAVHGVRRARRASRKSREET